jgi:hypothetical protein
MSLPVMIVVVELCSFFSLTCKNLHYRGTEIGMDVTSNEFYVSTPLFNRPRDHPM